MRLVRDDDAMDVDQVEQTATVRRSRGKKIKPVMVELPDGAVDAIDTPAAEVAADVFQNENDDAITPQPVAHDDEASQADSPAAVSLLKLEALLFATHHPLTAGRLAELLDLDSTKPIRGAIRDLNTVYADTGRAFRVEQVAGGYQMLTLPEHSELLKQMHQKDVDSKLGKAAMETLAIIAYKQPILRAEVEGIRGVACGETIRNLMEKHLVKIAGRAEEPGRPILYGTTKRFLEVFGLNSVKDLPQPENGAEPARRVAAIEQPIAAEEARTGAATENAPSELQPKTDAI
jgi:segregation and condensation protein B